jgi:uncharacterized membrane protein YeaQ/YmgE (transglycosylase-associated protein family)
MMDIQWIEIISFVIIAALCAAVAQLLAGFSVTGYLAALVAGFVGAWGMAWLAGVLDLPEILVVTINTASFPLVWAFIGALVLALVVSLLLQRMLLGTIEEVLD